MISITFALPVKWTPLSKATWDQNLFHQASCFQLQGSSFPDCWPIDLLKHPSSLFVNRDVPDDIKVQVANRRLNKTEQSFVKS